VSWQGAKSAACKHRQLFATPPRAQITNFERLQVFIFHFHILAQFGLVVFSAPAASKSSPDVQTSRCGILLADPKNPVHQTASI
jgi:hypothetical protein